MQCERETSANDVCKEEEDEDVKKIDSRKETHPCTCPKVNERYFGPPGSS